MLNARTFIASKLVFSLPLLLSWPVTGLAQGNLAAVAGTEQNDLFSKFETTLSGVKLVGRFTVVGRDREPAEEEYTIRSVKKLPEGDKWLFDTRIKYGEHDVSLPLPLDVKWAGDTPIITLSELNIPLLGTFSARVVIHQGKYAGTWSHGDVGGHLFGVIKPHEEADEGE